MKQTIKKQLQELTNDGGPVDFKSQKAKIEEEYEKTIKAAKMKRDLLVQQLVADCPDIDIASTIEGLRRELDLLSAFQKAAVKSITDSV